MSAIFAWIAWKRPIGCPKATRSLAYDIASSPEEIRPRHPAAVEGKGPSVGGVPAHLPVGLADLVSRRSVGDDDVRDLPVAVLAAGHRGDRHAARDLRPGIGDELLRAVDHPLAVVERRSRAGGAGVRPRLRL